MNTTILFLSTVNFLGIGDWGGYNLGSYHKTNVEAISKQLQRDEVPYDKALNTGDNFYYCGIQNLEDENISKDYTNLFSGLNYTWISSLGNHDYGYNVSAQLQLQEKVKNWYMPSRYYKLSYESKGIWFDIYVLDTNPCVSDYRNENPERWDPCGTEYPDCTPYTNQKPCEFHDNILSQSCSEQYEWFHKELTETHNSSRWTVAMGHHTMYQIDVQPFADLIDRYVDIYLNGHVHILGTYEYNSKHKYITTGAGAMVSQYVEIPNITTYKWYNKTTGYSRHMFTEDEVVNQFVNINGDVIYDFTVQKSR